METIKLIRKLARFFPKSIKSRGDRIGLMTGQLKHDTNTILLCLDFDDTVFNSIKKQNLNPDLILTHHPFIYGTRARVLKRNPVKRDLCERIDLMNIPVYSMHTNFDSGKNGMNDALANALGLKEIKRLETCKMARGGLLEKPMEIHEFAKYANKCLNIDYSHLIHAGKDKIESAAIIGGGGSYHYLEAMNEGYDIYISGDTPHHIRRDIISNNYNYLDVSHEVERIFIPQMKKILKTIDPSLNIIEVDHEELPELIVS